MKVPGVLLCILLLLTSFCGPKPEPKRKTVGPGSDDPLQQGRFATVFLSAMGSDGKLNGRICSGTYLGENLVLTNWHCMGCNKPDGCPDVGLQFGQMYHPEGWTQISKMEAYDRPPVPGYLARLTRGSLEADVAILKIFQVWGDPTAELPSPFPIPAISFGDSMKANLNDPIHVVGYPAIGFGTVNSDPGEITGFLDFLNNDNIRDTFKISAAINGGNSGGLLMNKSGEQIGIPQFRSAPELGVGVNGAIMIHVVVPFVEEAKKGTGTLTLPPTFVPSLPKIQEAKPLVGIISFGVSIEDAQKNPKTVFPPGVKEVSGVFQVIGARNGTPWGYVFYYNGTMDIDSRNSETWDRGPLNSMSVYQSNDQGLLGGKYELEIYFNGEALQRAAFTVEESTPQIQPPKTDVVIIKGSVVDAYTHFGISNARIAATKSGTSELNKLIFGATGVTDLFGDFTISLNVERGQTYNFEISAAGYKTLSRTDMFSATDPSLITYQPFELEPW